MSNGIFPRFFIKAVEHKAESEKQGRPIFRDVEYVEIRIAGDKNNVPVFKVNDEHRSRWPEVYKQFKAGLEQTQEGTPLDEWSVLPRSKVEEYKALGIYTVEALADLPDSAIHRIGMDARKIMAQAKAFIEDAKDNAKVNELAAQNEALKAELDLIKAQVSGLDKLSELQAENEALKAQINKPKRKRRTKAEIEADKANEAA